MRVIALIFAISTLIISCGKEDKNHEMCIWYGDSCHPDKATPTPEPEPGPPGPQGPIGPTGKNGKDGIPGTSCMVESTVGGHNIVCPNATAFVPDGVNGQDGYSVVSKVTNTAVSCLNGGKTLMVARDLNRNGVFDPLLDDEIQSLEICNGTDGTSEEFAPAIAITPCGPNSSVYKEALLGLTGGGVYSEVITQSGNANTIRNSLIPDGGYSDTDDSQCNFSISTAGDGDRSITWNGSSANGSGPYNPGNAHYDAVTKAWVATY